MAKLVPQDSLPVGRRVHLGGRTVGRDDRPKADSQVLSITISVPSDFVYTDCLLHSFFLVPLDTETLSTPAVTFGRWVVKLKSGTH